MNETEQLNEMIKKLQEMTAQALGMERYDLAAQLIVTIQGVQSELRVDKLKEDAARTAAVRNNR